MGPVRGARNAAEALRRLLEGTGFRAVAVAPGAFRIEPVPIAAPVVEPAQAADETPIVITALKRRQSLSTTPATVRSIPGGSLRSAYGLSDSSAIVRDLPALSMSQLGPGQNRLFLRGIGDGPLGGFNQSSVAIMFNESRLTFDAPDPDLALIDITTIEVLEGPQGPLYGTGALGGIVKITSAKPDLGRTSAQIETGLAAGEDGDLSSSEHAILNLPIDNNRLGARLVLYSEDTAGWIDNVGGRRDSDREGLIGGRLAIRWIPSADWSVDLVGAAQFRSLDDSRYVDGNLGRLKRSPRVPEPRDADARLLTLTVSGLIGRLRFESISGVSAQEAVAFYDAPGSTQVKDARRYVLINQEARLSNSGGGGVDWLAGLSLVKASTDSRVAARTPSAVTQLLVFHRDVTEAALFGEAAIKFGRGWTLNAGARLFYNQTEDERTNGGEQASTARGIVRAAASASLSWAPRAGRFFFVRAATAYRPGGVNIGQDSQPNAYEADELASAEFGARAQLTKSLALDSTLFATQWKHVQSDQLLPNGLIATRNSGDALNVGLEGRLRWSLSPGLGLEASVLLQSSRLERGSAGSFIIDDHRLPAVPDTALRTTVARTLSIGGWSGEARAGVRYSGATHLSFDPALDRRSRGFVTFDAGVSLARNGWAINLTGENLANSAADTFAFGNPYLVRAAPQRTPLRPRSIGIKLTRQF